MFWAAACSQLLQVGREGPRQPRDAAPLLPCLQRALYTCAWVLNVWGLFSGKKNFTSLNTIHWEDTYHLGPFISFSRLKVPCSCLGDTPDPHHCVPFSYSEKFRLSWRFLLHDDTFHSSAQTCMRVTLLVTGSQEKRSCPEEGLTPYHYSTPDAKLQSLLHLGLGWEP